MARTWSGHSASRPERATRAKKIGTFDGPRFTNACAIDVAQVAAELVVYARTLGTSADEALADADALMRGFALKLEACSGLAIDKNAWEVTKDAWPALREALARWAPPKIGGGPAPSAATSASAAPSASAAAP